MYLQTTLLATLAYSSPWRVVAGVWPCTSLVQALPAPTPRGLTTPSPVTTTRGATRPTILCKGAAGVFRYRSYNTQTVEYSLVIKTIQR